MQSISTAELVRAARAGDVTGFAGVVERHRTELRAVAIAGLGYTADADDAVQDAILIALRRLADLRDPAHVLPWLKTIVRNECRMLLRGNRTTPVADPAALLPAGRQLDPAGEFERANLQIWVRDAIDGLPTPVREVTLLRYFSDFRSYRAIAEVCGVPVETVRSRLQEGRRVLTRTLRVTAEDAHRDDHSAAEASRREAEAALTAGRDGHYREMVYDRFHPDATVVLSGRSLGGRHALIDLMNSVVDAGVVMRFRDATAGRNVMIWETGFINPASDPEHCPPTMVWLYALKDQRVDRLRMAYGR